MSDFVFINGDEDLLASCNGEFKEVLDVAQVLSNQRNETVIICGCLGYVEPEER